VEKQFVLTPDEIVSIRFELSTLVCALRLDQNNQHEPDCHQADTHVADKFPLPAKIPNNSSVPR
jgi:hypothetical protein